MLSAILAILKFVAVLGVFALFLAFFIKYAIPLILYAFRFVVGFLALLPAWVAPFVLLSVGLAVLALIVRII